MKMQAIMNFTHEVAHDADPVATACGVIGAMAGIITEYADADAAIIALRQFADETEKIQEKAKERREAIGKGKTRPN